MRELGVGATRVGCPLYVREGRYATSGISKRYTPCSYPHRTFLHYVHASYNYVKFKEEAAAVRIRL